MTEEKPKLGIALSGGGARGIAHIGVLKALREEGIIPDVLAGASAGAIIGALHAAGKTPEEMLNFVKDSSIWRIFRVGIPYDGLTKLTYLRQRLKETLQEDSFEALQHKLFVTVANLNTGQLRTVSEGPLFDFVVASSSVPLVFKPIEIDGELYVDGGLINNLPVEPLLDEAQHVLGVNAMPTLPVTNKDIQTVFGIATRCFELSIYANSRANINQCHLVITPEELQQYHIFQFNKYQSIHDIGYRAAKKAMPDIVRMLAD